MEKEKKDLPQILVTERKGAPADKAVLETKAGIEDVQVVTAKPWVLSLIRAARTYGQGLAANIMTGGTAVAAVTAMVIDVSKITDIVFLATAIAVVIEPLRTAVVTFIYNMLEFTAHLDKSNPKIRG